jgi:hypothetical protein
MFWKTFVISFFFHHHKNIGTVLRNSNFIEDFLPSPPIPEKNNNRINPVLLNKFQLNESFLNQSFLNQSFLNQSFFAGFDQREPPFKNETLYHMTIMNITHFNKQMDLLSYLENNRTSQADKLTAIADYNRNNKPSPMKSNLFAGGLFDEWNNKI